MVRTAVHRQIAPVHFKAFRRSPVKRSFGTWLLQLLDPFALIGYMMVAVAVLLFCCTYGGFFYNAIHISFELPQPITETYGTSSSY
jgi:hypothetical protein